MTQFLGERICTTCLTSVGCPHKLATELEIDQLMAANGTPWCNYCESYHAGQHCVEPLSVLITYWTCNWNTVPLNIQELIDSGLSPYITL